MNIRKTKKLTTTAMLGLFCGAICQAAVMMLWNYLITPVYLGYPREEVVKLLLPVFLPFNLIKGGLNGAFTMLLYKPVVTALRRFHVVESAGSPEKMRINMGVLLAALFVIITCVLLILSFHEVI